MTITSLPDDVVTAARRAIASVTGGAYEPGDITPDMLLFEPPEPGAQSLSLDSLQFVDIVLALESRLRLSLLDEIGAAMDDGQDQTVRTVGDFCGLLGEMLAAGDAGPA